jgi:SAM-dependent methyltransferase
MSLQRPETRPKEGYKIRKRPVPIKTARPSKSSGDGNGNLIGFPLMRTCLAVIPDQFLSIPTDQYSRASQNLPEYTQLLTSKHLVEFPKLLDDANIAVADEILEYVRPTVKSMCQFHTMFTIHKDLLPSLRKIVEFAPPIIRHPNIRELVWKIIKSCDPKQNNNDNTKNNTKNNNKHVITDDIIYSKLREFVLKEGVVSEDEVVGGTVFDEITLNNRGANRARNIVSQLPQNFHPKRILDIGCSDGSITSSLRFELGISRSNTYAVDVRDIRLKTYQNDFEFHQLAQGDNLPFETGTFSLVTAIMSLHHVSNFEEMVTEVLRVLEPGGYFVLREHDCSIPNFDIVLDIMHGLFCLVWSHPLEDPDFIVNYTANYQSRESWLFLLKEVGFICVTPFHQNPSKNIYRQYIDVFQKSKSQSKCSEDHGDDDDNNMLTRRRSDLNQSVGCHQIGGENYRSQDGHQGSWSIYRCRPNRQNQSLSRWKQSPNSKYGGDNDNSGNDAAEEKKCAM